MMTEVDWKLAISELKTTATEVRGDVAELMKRLAGTAVGKVGESITTKSLKSLCQSDEFSAEKAAKGTDIVATVKENGESFGNIAISVKYDVSWGKQFVTQLRKNMKQEGTPFGLLVTKVFPADSLNDKAYVMENKNGQMLLLVKPEYAEVAYYGFRHAAIAWEKANTIIRDVRQKIQERQRITKAIIDWISGQGFKMATEKIDNAIEYSSETNKEVEHLRSYVDQKSNKIQQIQEELRSDLRTAKSALQHLKDLLDDKKDEG